MSIERFWQAVSRRLDAGSPVFVAMVVANTRGSPGTLGARLLLDPDAAVEGTIGGGIMEVRLLDEAKERLRRGADERPVLQRLAHRKEIGERKKDDYQPSGLICAGEQTNLSLILEPERDGDAIRRFCHAIENQSSCSATLTIDEQGLRVEQSEPPGTEPGMQLIEDDDAWRYTENSVNPLRLAVVGGGHCGKALARLALQVGYWVDVFDTRTEVMEGELWPDKVRRHVLNEYDDLNAQLGHPQLTTVVVMTAAVHYDIAALASVASTHLRWLGVMGSAAKIHEIQTQLKERKIEQHRIDAIHGPIGLPMKSDTPPEIAVSIMSQLLAERR